MLRGNIQIILPVHGRILHLSSSHCAENGNFLLGPRLVLARGPPTKTADRNGFECSFDLVPVPGADYFLYDEDS